MSSTVVLKLKIDGEQYEAEMEDAKKQLRDLTKQAQGVSGSMAQWSMIVTGFNQALEVAGKLASILEKPVGTAAMFEQYEVQLKVLLKSTGAARNRLQELAEFGKNTPFEFDEVIEASRKLEVLTRGALSTGEGLKMVGDVSAGVGVPISELSMWFGRLYDGIDSGRPVGEALMRLQELGALSGEARGKIETLQKQNASSTEVWAVVTEEMSKFNGMMDAQSATWDGLVSNIEDATTLILRDIGDKMLPTLKSWASMVIDFLGVFSKQSDQLREQQFEFNALMEVLRDVNTEEDTRLRVIKELQDKYPDYIENIDLETASVDELAKMQKTANDEFERKILLMAAEEQLADIQSKTVAKQKELFDLEIELKKLEAESASTQLGAETTRSGFDTMRVKADIKSVKEEIKESKQEYQEFMSYVSENGIDLTGGKKKDGGGKNKSGNEDPVRIPVVPEIQIDDIEFDGDEALKDLKLMADLDLKEMQAQRMQEGIEKELQLLDIWKERQMQAYSDDASAREEILNTYLHRQDELEHAHAENRERIREAEYQAQINSARDTLNILGGMIANHTLFGKAIAIFQATINTYEGATKALAQGGILGILNMGAVIASGLAQVHKITSTKTPKMPGYEHGGAIVGENGVEIIAPAKDFASGMDNLILAVENALSSRNAGIMGGSITGMDELRTDIKELLSRPSRSYLDNREAKKIGNYLLSELGRTMA